jgi:hypothetical protein
MAVNTITNLIPDLYEALDVVSRELVGFIPSVAADFTFERAAVGQTVRSPVAPASTASDITPAVIPPDDGEQTIGNVSMTITKAKRVPIRWNGEQSLGLNNNGPTRSRIMVDQFTQGMRTLCNLVEADLAALHATASRAVGTAGTTPFGTAGDFSDAANALKVLKDNGAPTSDVTLVMDTVAGAKMIGLQSRYDVAGDTTMQRQGIILEKAGMKLRESAAVLTPVVGTGSAYTSDTAGYAVGATSINLITGTGTILAGDVISFAGDPNKYVVATGLSAPGAVVIAAPGLRQALPASAKAVTISAAATRNMVFSRNALALATRAPALPEEGDSAADRTIITDPRSGLSFEVAMYKQYRQVQYEIALAWGVKCIKPEHMGLLLG